MDCEHLNLLPLTIPELSIVIPFYNEEQGCAAFVEEVHAAACKLNGPLEILLIDDGSADGTGAELLRSAADRKECRVVTLARNSGQAAAMYAGMKLAQAAIIATLDGDGQNVPADLHLLLEQLQSTGADMVAGVRQNRDDSWLRLRMSRVANRVRSAVLRDQVRDTGCGLKVFRREVVDCFMPIRTLYSFMPAFAAAAGFRVVEQPVQHRARTLGTSKYGLGVMLWRPLLDLLGVWWFTRRRFRLPSIHEVPR